MDLGIYELLAGFLAALRARALCAHPLFRLIRSKTVTICNSHIINTYKAWLLNPVESEVPQLTAGSCAGLNTKHSACRIPAFYRCSPYSASFLGGGGGVIFSTRMKLLHLLLAWLSFDMNCQQEIVCFRSFWVF
jgi:hypothetical protein